MARPDNFYVVEWRNPALDEHVHFLVIQVDADDSVLRHIRILQGHNKNLQIDEKQSLPRFPNKPAAIAEADKRADVANQANPDRVGADQRFPNGEANRALHVGFDEPPAQ
jgi:hypothetical protein